MSLAKVFSVSGAIALVRDMHPAGCVIDAWETNDGYDVLVWETEAEAKNDDGARAIARYYVTRAGEGQ